MEEINSDISSKVASVVYAAIGVSRKNRFSSASAMRRALLAAIDQVGPRLKLLRTQRGATLTALAEATAQIPLLP